LFCHNFGHIELIEFYEVGINGKISELNVAMGLAVFPHLNEIIPQLKKVTKSIV